MKKIKQLEWNKILTHGGDALSASFYGWNWRIYLRGIRDGDKYIKEQKQKAQKEFEEQINNAFEDK